MKILVVDDERMLRLAIRVNIYNLDKKHVVLECTTEREAIEALKERPDAVLTDLDIKPDGNGIRVIEKAREILGGDKRICLMSAGMDVALQERASKAGANRFLSKPFFLPELKEALGLAQS